MRENRRLIVIAGTNASGKSDLAVTLAGRYGGEVVSADSRQVFRGLDLGSGKITQADMRGVPHHLIDVCDPRGFFSMGDFQRMAYEAIDGILARGRLPFLAGGTGLYISAVADGYVLSEVRPDLGYRDELEKLTTPELFEMLRGLSPDTAVDPNNRNRVMRAIEKIHDGDTHVPAREPRYQTLKLGVTWDRPTLCRRIDERLVRRMDEGMEKEIEGLLDAGVDPDFLKRLGLEYRYVTQFVLGELSKEEMLEELARAIKRFAKRQMTWFRRDPDIHWLDMAGDPVEEAASLIDRFVKTTESSGGKNHA